MLCLDGTIPVMYKGVYLNTYIYILDIFVHVIIHYCEEWPVLSLLS